MQLRYYYIIFPRVAAVYKFWYASAMSSLFIVATPIGNLEDMTPRAVRVLCEVSLILSEDTRVTRKLLAHFEIHTPLKSYHAHSGSRVTQDAIGLLQGGKDLALTTDAGTPGISDPGGLLVAAVVRELGDRVKIVPIPGPTAATAALSISGFPTHHFLFLGFPPQKHGRAKFFDRVASSSVTTVIYESPHRIMDALARLHERLDSSRQIMVCRELTKIFETTYRGNVSEVTEKLKSDTIKGEFVVVISAT